ncbi:MAG: FAD-dependent oxidoreductase [Candidatus Aminicenantes bacterium]
MRAVVVGNGLAGTLAAKTLRELDGGVDIEVFGEESHAYYPRPNLIEFLAGRLPYERLFAFPGNWAERQRIGLHLGVRISKILADEKAVVTDAGQAFPYDALLLANGARASVPPLRGGDRKGVFVLRTLDDALAILDYLERHTKVAVIGGGLLGLEIARALRTRGAEVRVVELLDRLLPRQLDTTGAAILKDQIERTGIAVRLGTATEEILGDGQVLGLRFKGGDQAEAEVVIIAAGVDPDLELAREAGLRVDRGIVVDDRLGTSRPEIFAAGDVAEHRGRVYGIIPASFEQARAAAHNMLSMDLPYQGTVASNTLKVAGLYVTSAGLAVQEEGTSEVLTRQAPEEGLYKKIVLREGRIVGAIWMGTKKGAAEISRLVAGKKDVSTVKHDLFEENFDFDGI